jgi:hypothetical protein
LGRRIDHASQTTGKEAIVRDHRGGGVDDDLLSDGCVRIATLNDLNAETTGGIFNADGTKYDVSIQHNVTGHGVVFVVTGWDF